MERHPPDILITTPESLFLILTSAARKILASVRWLIVDEIHSVAATKRGSHLALSLERLCAVTRTQPQRIGLSATQRPLEEVARFLGGTSRDVAIVDAGRLKTMEVSVEVPVDDMSRLSVQDVDDRLRQFAPSLRAHRGAPQRAGGRRARACPSRLHRARAAPSD
jgi:ATP-dependent Lhr-like helicase